MRTRLRVCVPIALLALALLAPAAVAAPERTVSVNASATVKVANDTARLGFSASAERRSRGAALRAVSARLRAVIAAVQAIPGVGPGDVKTGRISLRKASRGKRVVYRAGEGIGVILHEPGNAGDLVSAAIRAGAAGVSGPTFFVGDTEAAYARALAAAFEKARSRATTLATEAGAVLGPAISIEEGGGVEIVQEGSTKAAPTAGCGATPVSASSSKCTVPAPPVKPGTSTVTATVGVVFVLQ
ncbi:MAG: SIMPL domain-containing protein [Solirubrobacterales bacterium]